MDPVDKIKSLTPEDFSEICRICLSSEALRLIQETLVDNIEATDLFEYTIGVQFDKNDLMPDNICVKCLATLHEMYKLKKQCLINELLFKTQINNYKTLQKEEIQNDTVKREKEGEEDIILSNGDTVNTITTTSDAVLELNNVKIEPVDYDLALENGKRTKTDGILVERKIVASEHTIGTAKIEQPIINVLNNVKNTQQPIILPSIGIPRIIKQSNTSIGSTTTFPMTTPIIFNSSAGSYTSNVVKPVYIVNYQQNPVNNLRIVPGAKVPVTNQVYLLNYQGPNKPASVAPTTFDTPPPEPKKKRDNTKVPCTICKKLIGCRSMAAHLITHQAHREMYQCDQCPRTFKTKSNLRLHRIQHTGKYPCKCPKCKKGFKEVSYLKHHMAICKKDKEEPKHFICKVCGQNFANRVAFRRHLGRHLAQKETDKEVVNEYLKDYPFSCDVCLTSYRTEVALKNHIKNTHSGESFLCNICGKNLASKGGLDQHMKTHTGEKVHSCKVCQKSFITSGSLRSHMLIHSDERPFKCNICLKRFKIVSRLNGHLLLHKGHKPHQCTFCDKKFAEAGNLRKHVATHTGEKRHFCSICNKGFYDKNMMTNHEAKHKTNAKKSRKKTTKDTDQDT